MIWAGISMIWLILIYLFKHKAKKLLKNIHLHRENRVDHLQNRLHNNFVFSDRKKLKRFPFLILWIWWIEHQRSEKFKKQLLHLIPSLSSMLRSGHGIERALTEIKKTIPAPMSEEIHLVLKEMQLGSSLEEALQKLNTRFYSENLQMFVHAIIIARKLGTSLSEAIDHISNNILEKEKLKQQVSALTSQGKMQAYIAVCMPFLLGLVLQWISPGYFEPLFSTFAGKCSLIYCIFSLTLGLFCIRKITHKEYF